MKEPKLSIIVSVYNTEKYVSKCIDAILNQTYQNIELIIINDGSTDNSLNVIKKYFNDKRVKFIDNQINKGLSYSRNIGLKEASGNYVGFIDSDDFIDSNYYESLMDSIINEQADMAICDMKFKYTGIDEHELLVPCSPEYPFNKVNVIDCGIAASACNKVFKKELIMKYEFAEGKVNEDIAVVIPAIVNAKKVVYTPDVYYYYMQRNNSMQNSRFQDKRFDIFIGVDDTLKRIENCPDYDKIKDAIVYNQIIVILSNIIPKEKNLFRRYHILKKFHQLSQKYNIRQNNYYWRFIDLSGKRHQIYYKSLYKAVDNNHITLANLLILAYDFLSIFIKTKPVITKATIDDVKVAAIYNCHLREPKIKISVVVPNYNYARFMYQRIYSILCQDYKISELIILDDCSKDESREVIDKIAKAIKNQIKIRTIYNDTNSGSAFKQWQKGFKEASYDYVWIAEADDYCSDHFLKNVVKPIHHDSNIMISYTNTAFIDVNGNIIVKSIIPEIDIQKSNHWEESYINNGLDEIKNYSYLNCTIANVSSCIIKKDNYDEYFKLSGEYKQAGDWLFYVNVMQHGNISYHNEILNYYRVHGNNVSSTMNHEKHIAEINKIHAYYLKQFKLDHEHEIKMQERIQFLKDAWHLK